MAEYIEREALIDIFRSPGSLFVYGEQTVNAIISRIKMQSAADVAEVKRGEWYQKRITVPKARGHSYLVWACSVCHKHERKRSDFCPNCGAKMMEMVGENNGNDMQ
jgi:rubrerythrin